jgi:hypothetical protein
MLRLLLILAAGIALASCASAAQQQSQAQALAAQDDARCHSYGLHPGTDAYGLCRLNIDNARTAASENEDQEAVTNYYLLRH